MAGRQSARENEMALLWHGENLHRSERLKPIKAWLGQFKPKRQQAPSEMLAVLRELQAKGAKMKIEAIPRLADRAEKE
jgi:hypothetical protein